MAAASTSTCTVTTEEPVSANIEQAVPVVAATMKTTHASIRYLKWQDLYSYEKPFQIFLNIPPDAIDQRESNLVFEEVDRNIEDIRGREGEFTLDENGFQFVNYDSVDHSNEVRKEDREEVDFKNKEKVETQYLPRIEKLIKEKVEGADEVFIFDWRVRKDEEQVGEAVFDMNDPTQYLRPAEMVHIDQSPHAVINRIRLQLSHRADFLLSGRVRILNAWRPLNHPVENFHLALCDGSTVATSDLIEADHVRRRYLGSTMYLLNNEKQRWVFLDRQTPGEVTLFKNFDSEEDISATVAPHVAINVNPDKSARPRESVEVRALVFTHPKDQQEEHLAPSRMVAIEAVPQEVI